ncbi:hypothetical protein ACFVVX_33795 [Kitasatospora sp. NPDC058170]|uniref:hypothetical protein n=1 Tax=Kitasatospora sp. NPDC058170 TaxID=3346364 RepID=UPI0036D9B5E1
MTLDFAAFVADATADPAVVGLVLKRTRALPTATGSPSATTPTPARERNTVEHLI